MESKKINQLATELSPDLSDLTIIGDPTTGISKKITLSQMASLFTGTVEEYANLAAFPLVGVADTIYIAQDTNIIYRWTGSAYVELSPNVVSSLVFNDANGFDGTIVLASSVATLTITTALTLGSLPFIGASGALTQDNANLFYDDTNNRLGIGTNAPTTPLDVFGSGIIARINGTSTNNGFLGFSNAGTNKWSVGNVQSDHRFRIYSEANSAELVSVLQTGEFGIGIANPTTKLHIDGGATALIANLDANVSIGKSISFRSDNSNRINLEVSGTESGSNVGADFFIRRYTDLGALIDTPLTITRSTGLITLATALSGTSATFSSSVTQSYSVITGAQPGGLGANKSIMDFSGGTARWFSYGADASTNGAFLLNSQRSDGSNAISFLSIASTGQITQGTTISDWSYVMSNSNATSPNGIIIQYTAANKNNTANPFLYCVDNSGTALRMEIRSNGGIANYSANDVNLSDERVKKDIEPLESYWDKFKAIEIVKFKYKDQTHDDFNIGVIAQQVEAVAPEFVDVDGWDNKPKLDEEGNEIINDEEPLKSIYTADLYHATIKVLQECMSKIEELKSEIDLLKGIAPIEPEPIEEVEPIPEVTPQTEPESEPKAEPIEPEVEPTEVEPEVEPEDKTESDAEPESEPKEEDTNTTQ